VNLGADLVAEGDQEPKRAIAGVTDADGNPGLVRLRSGVLSAQTDARADRAPRRDNGLHGQALV